MISLDEPRIFEQYDLEDMLGHLHRLPELCRQAWQMAAGFDLPSDYGEVDKIVVSGMGGSAISGSLAASLILSESQVPVFVHRDYGLPAFVDGKTLVIASSYSGMTEETLSSFEMALKLDSKKLVMTTGGRLKALAEENNVPVFGFDYKSPPRAALPFSFLPILCFMGKLGFIADRSAEVGEMAKVLENLAA